MDNVRIPIIRFANVCLISITTSTNTYNIEVGGEVVRTIPYVWVHFEDSFGDDEDSAGIKVYLIECTTFTMTGNACAIKNASIFSVNSRYTEIAH